MRIELHGKEIRGEGSRDEPPAAHHVLARLLGHRVERVTTRPATDARGERIEVTMGRHLLTCEVRIEQGRSPDHWVAELQVNVTHAEQDDPGRTE